jgi:Putative beta-barrel porin-2, OmpL-like. bbp2
MDDKVRKVGMLLVALGCASMCPACVAQAPGKSAQKPILTNIAEYASTRADGSGNSAAPATPDPAATPAVTTEIAPTAAVSGAELRPAILKELEAMKQRIAELEAELAAGSGVNASDAANALQGEKEKLEPTAAPPALLRSGLPPAGVSQAESVQPVTQPPPVPEKTAPFSDADWTWLNGNPRNRDTAYDSKFFTPEIRADITYNYDFNKPIDDSIGGSSEIFRANEIQLEQLGVGGDFHFENVRARFMTQFGTYSTATVRNDPSYAKGQWTLNEADRILSEAYGGYHINTLHGINIDAGIFMSYIGLFSYYNFDNWAYQPSYVSSNTPWFFQGLRVQIFPTAHLKIEPWVINGWQSYASANSRKGLGGQIKYTPKPWMNIISNNYGLGHDDLYLPNRGRLHTDNSIEIKYYDRPENTLDKMAFSFTGDVGCEFGNGVSCHGDKAGGPKQSFLGYMVYDRTWFKRDLYGLTLGGGQINNPGRYLVLLPPINGETAASAAINSPYFTENPGNPFKAWDSSITFDYMPKQWITFRWEYDYRHANVPYWTGHGGITPPAFLGSAVGTNNGFPTQYACFDGTPSATINGCGNNGGTWFPDLRRDESFIDLDLMVKF